jgi:hypothetical protein
LKESTEKIQNNLGHRDRSTLQSRGWFAPSPTTINPGSRILHLRYAWAVHPLRTKV